MELELTLGRNEQAYLAAIKATPGFKVLDDIAKSEVNKFIQRLINIPSDDKEAVLSAHMAAKVAAQMYAGFVNRINFEIDQYMNTPTLRDKPKDLTEGILDLGEYSASDDINIID
jgi:hypothetical protein